MDSKVFLSSGGVKVGSGELSTDDESNKGVSAEIDGGVANVLSLLLESMVEVSCGVFSPVVADGVEASGEEVLSPGKGGVGAVWPLVEESKVVAAAGVLLSPVE